MAGMFEDLVPQSAPTAKDPAAQRGAAPSKAPAQSGQMFADLIPSSPVSSSTFENVAAGAGAKLTDLALGAKQRWDEAAAYLENKFGGKAVNQALGLPNADQVLQNTQAEVADKRQLDAPLMATKAGKVGAVVGSAAPALIASFVPGGQGLAGSIVSGATMGAAEPTMGDESALNNAALGGAAGALGYGAGKYVADKAAAAKAAAADAAAANAGRDAAAVAAKDAGFVLPPTQTNPTTMNKALEGLAGKVSTSQKASIANQQTTNKLAARALGLPEDQPVTVEALKAVRQAAGQQYEAVRNAGLIKADARFAKELGDITSTQQGASRSFPGLVKDDVEALVTSLKQPMFDAGDAVDAIKVLRNSADSAFAKGDKSAAKAFKDASNALEGVIDRHLQATGSTDAVAAFRDARQLIAKTYSVEKALNPANGNVSAAKLGSQLVKGKPLSGELKQVAEAATAFPTALRDIKDSIPGVSPLDWVAAGGMSAAAGNPLLLGTAAVRPLARSTILSPAYQRAMGTPTYGTKLADLLALKPVQEGVRLSTMAISPQLAQQK